MIKTSFMMLAAGLVLWLAFYAQKQLFLYMDRKSGITAIRVLLLVVGLAFGLVLMLPVSPLHLKLLTFLIGFGLVHIPAAIILFIKSRR